MHLSCPIGLDPTNGIYSPEDDEPYEYLLVWENDDNPLRPSEDPKNWSRSGVLS
jgi:hypothetical protein